MPLGDVQLELVNSVEMANKFFSWLSQSREVLGFDTETTGLDPEAGRLRLVQFGDMNAGWSIPWEGWGGVALEALEAYDGPLVGHNAKFDVRWLELHGNIKMKRQNVHCTRLMCHILDPSSSTALKPNAARFVDAKAAHASKALDHAMSEQKWTWATVPIDFQPYWVYGALDTVLTAHLFNVLWPKIQAEFLNVYELEQAVQFVLGDMEARGARIDLNYTNDMSEKLDSYAKQVDDWCMQTYQLKPGSNAAVSKKLIELGADLRNTTPSGTVKLDEESILTQVLFVDELDKFDFPNGNEAQQLAYQVLKRRKSEKIRSTYLDTFIDLVDADGFVHPQINQLGARTGRMSMERPALQTLPRGRIVRDCFIPREGNNLISADFDGIEMRILAHFAGDNNLIAAINSGDIHLDTARRVYGDETIQKKDPRRQVAKSVGFAKIYGAGPEKIALTAGTSIEATKEFLKRYDESFPGVKAFQGQVAHAVHVRRLEEGRAYVKTPIGRLELADGDREYALVNALIQGMAADVFKEALVRLDDTDAGQYLLLPVHDEVIVDAPAKDIEEIKRIVVDAMYDDRWAVPLTVGVDGPLDRWGSKYGG